MSDFGCAVAAYRVDGVPVGPADENRVRVAARGLQFTELDRIGPFDEFDLRFGAAQRSDRTEKVLITLADYFIDDDEGNDGLDTDVIIARGAVVPARFAAELERALGDDYQCEWISDHW